MPACSPISSSAPLWTAITVGRCPPTELIREPEFKRTLRATLSCPRGWSRKCTLPVTRNQPSTRAAGCKRRYRFACRDHNSVMQADKRCCPKCQAFTQNFILHQVKQFHLADAFRGKPYLRPPSEESHYTHILSQVRLIVARAAAEHPVGQRPPWLPHTPDSKATV